MATENLFDHLLSDDLLLIILDFIPLVKQIPLRLVSKRFKKLIDYKLKTRTGLAVALSIDDDDDDEEEEAEETTQEFNAILDCSELRHTLTTNDCIYKWCRPIRDGSRTLYVLSDRLVNNLFQFCPNIKTLSLKYTIFDQNVWQFFRDNCPKDIQHLDLSDSQGLIDEVLRFIVTSCGPSLRHVFLNDSDISESTLKYLVDNCSNLEILDITTNVRITGQCFEVMPQSLQRLSISNCWNLTADAISSLFSRTANSLKCLQMNGEIIQNETLELICDNMSLLTLLDIDCSNVTDKRVLAKMSKFTKLEELVLCLPSINFDIILVDITRRNPRLTKLSIDGAIITDNSIKCLPDFCPQLEILSISSGEVVVNKKITDITCESLCKLKKLRELDLQYTRIGDKLGEVIDNCTDIESVDIDGCKKVTNAFVDRVIDILTHRRTACLTIVARETKLSRPEPEMDNLILIVD